MKKSYMGNVYFNETILYYGNGNSFFGNNLKTIKEEISEYIKEKMKFTHKDITGFRIAIHWTNIEIDRYILVAEKTYGRKNYKNIKGVL